LTAASSAPDYRPDKHAPRTTPPRSFRSASPHCATSPGLARMKPSR